MNLFLRWFFRNNLWNIEMIGSFLINTEKGGEFNKVVLPFSGAGEEIIVETIGSRYVYGVEGFYFQMRPGSIIATDIYISGIQQPKSLSSELGFHHTSGLIIEII